MKCCDFYLLTDSKFVIKVYQIEFKNEFKNKEFKFLRIIILYINLTRIYVKLSECIYIVFSKLVVDKLNKWRKRKKR